MIDKICNQCRVELRPKKNGVVVVPMAVYGPMSIHRGDLWRCHVCGVEMVLGLSAEAELNHFDPAFQARLDSYDLDPREQVIRFFASPREKVEYESLAAKEREVARAHR